MQAVSSLQQEKAAADREASQWKLQVEEAYNRIDSLETGRSVVEGQLQAQSAEADKLCMSYEKQAEVSSRSYSVNSPTVATQQVGFHTVNIFLLFLYVQVLVRICGLS